MEGVFLVANPIWVKSQDSESITLAEQFTIYQTEGGNFLISCLSPSGHITKLAYYKNNIDTQKVFKLLLDHINDIDYRDYVFIFPSIDFFKEPDYDDDDFDF
jgi:hypothetical protein